MDFQMIPLANSVEPDQPAHSRRLIWVYAGRKVLERRFLIGVAHT